MNNKHLPHYGFCYVRNYEWEPVFLIQKRKTARIKDVNKSQGKLTANLSSLVWLYFYYKVLSRSFLEMFFFKKKILLLVRIQLKLTQSQQMYSYWSFCTRGAMLVFFLFILNHFFFYALQHTDMGYGSGSAAGTWMSEDGWSLVEETFKGSWCLIQAWVLYAESSASPAQIQARSNNDDAEPQSAVPSVQHSCF